MGKRLQCHSDVWHGYGVGHLPCKLEANIAEKGVWWCRMHAPSVAEAKKDARGRKYAAEDAYWKAEKQLTIAREKVIETARLVVKLSPSTPRSDLARKAFRELRVAERRVERRARRMEER